MMLAMNPVWDEILEATLVDDNGKPVKKELSQGDIRMIHERLGMDPKIENETNKMLFINLLEYKKSDTHA